MFAKNNFLILMILFLSCASKSKNVSVKKNNSEEDKALIYEFERWFRPIGVINDIPVFETGLTENREEKFNELLNRFGIYYGLSDDSKNIYYKLLKKISFGTIYPAYITDSIEIYQINDYHINIKLKGEELVYQYNKFPIFTSTRDENHLFFSDGRKKLFHVDTRKTPLKMDTLPLVGFNPKVMGEYLYFEGEFWTPGFSLAAGNVFRVTIGDWNNPELLLEDVEDYWQPMPDNKSINAEIPFKNNKLEKVFYSIEQKKYAKAEELYKYVFPRKDGYYWLKDTVTEIHDRYKMYKMSSSPQEYTFRTPEDRNLISFKRDYIYNLPIKEKQFSGTFITDELLYNADEQILKSLTKKELRLLRNAFYARQGYNFKSKDLKAFFSQFSWYKELLKSNAFFEKTNALITVTKEDKKRAEYIKTLELKK